MNVEVSMALSFIISFLYNKLPRRRVNIFGEELEKAMKDKFKGHWYPEKPFKGSAYRCIKTGDPIDPVLERAARESGVPIQDILEYLPAELAVWVDPNEVSYRIGETSQVKILYSEPKDSHDESSIDREVTKTFNPEAQCFRPIEAVASSLSGLCLSPKSSSPFSSSIGSNGSNAFMPRSTAPLTFTTATFAQTKFGSTKLKTSSKRANRMSPTEFSNYIKQRAMQQQIHHHHPHQAPSGPVGSQGPQTPGGLPVSQASPNNRSLSPGLAAPPQPAYHPQFQHRNIFDSPSSHNGYLAAAAADLYSGGAKFSSSYLDPIGHQFYGGSINAPSQNNGSSLGPIGSGLGSATSVNSSLASPVQQQQQQQQQSDKGALTDGLGNFGLGSVTPYPASNYQHLLVAN
ncbi:hypothetical protein QAD02_015796 [Eretmocerus hayati]|uniref:Uncharacterized protein n=1 Tax=Eretmocerus hayati TaxID=131215 RepID=A0ACC2P9N5_9HYME|nr:hypothetical protein QAD02_015796 [Eretmocerus hayati]